MRILHTSDWHLGRTLEGRSRMAEQESFINELCGIVEEEKVNIVIIAGDVFDTVNPPAAAEELFFEALDRLANGGKRAVIAIAGNHDNPERIRAASPLAVRNGITLCGFPKEILTVNAVGSGTGHVSRAAAGQGWVRLSIPGLQEDAVVTMLPYPSEARLNEVLNQSLDEELIRQEYSLRVKRIFADLAANYRPDTVNLAVSHLFVRGGAESDSERPIQLGGAPTVEPDVMPPGSHYVALGHLHRPQKVKKASVSTRYSGSPLAYSFSEAGYAKSVVLIEAFPGKEASIKEIFVNSGYPLVKWKAYEGLDQVWHWIEEGKDYNAWIDLEIHTSRVLNAQEVQDLRRTRERIVNIRPVFPATEKVFLESRSKMPLDELFKRFYNQKMGAEPENELIELFLSLINSYEEEIQGEEEGETA